MNEKFIALFTRKYGKKKATIINSHSIDPPPSLAPLWSIMDAKVAIQHACSFITLQNHNPRTHKRRPKHSPFVLAVISKAPAKVTEPSTSSVSNNVYNDNWFDRIAIDHLSQSLQKSAGSKQNCLSFFSGVVITLLGKHLRFDKYRDEKQQEWVWWAAGGSGNGVSHI